MSGVGGRRASSSYSATIGDGSSTTISVAHNLKIRGAGLYTTQTSQTPTVTIAVNLGSITLASWASTATAAQANLPWNFELEAETVSTGASGTLEAHGNLNIRLGSGAGALSVFADGNTAVSSAIDLTAAQTLQVTVTFSTNTTTANTCAQRQMSLTLGN